MHSYYFLGDIHSASESDNVMLAYVLVYTCSNLKIMEGSLTTLYSIGHYNYMTLL